MPLRPLPLASVPSVRSVVVTALMVVGVSALGASALSACGGGRARPSSASRVVTQPSLSRPPTAQPSVGRSQVSTSVTSQSRDTGTPLIDHIRWITNSKGLQLQVYPTAAGRTDDSPAAAERAWAEVLAASGTSGTAAAMPLTAGSGSAVKGRADSPGMHDQFLCHWNFARLVQPDKPSWNLEPWRPAVGYSRTVAALCNPGGPEG